MGRPALKIEGGPLRRTRSLAPIRLGVARVLALIALACAAGLVILDFTTGFLESPAHQVISAAPLAAVALAYLVDRAIKHPSLLEALKAVLLASAFLLWAAFQLAPGHPQIAILNDLAIALFVVDMVLVISGTAADTESL